MENKNQKTWLQKEHRDKMRAEKDNIIRLRQEGKLTLDAIGQKYGVSRQRIHQIITGK